MAVIERDTIKDQRKAQGTLTAVDDAVTLSRFTTWGTVGIQITGTFTATVQFECTVDGSTWVAVSATPSNSVTTATSATAVGAWSIPNVFFQAVRVRCSAWTSAPTVTIISRPSQF